MQQDINDHLDIIPPGIEPQRYAALLSHASTLFAIAFKSPQPTSTVISEYLHKKDRLSAGEKSAVRSLVFNALRFYPAAAYSARIASSECDVPALADTLSQYDIYAVKFLADTACAAVCAAAVLIRIEHEVNRGRLHPAMHDTLTALIVPFASKWMPAGKEEQWIAHTAGANRLLMKRASTVVQPDQPCTGEDEYALAVGGCVQPWILKTWASHREGGWAGALRLANSLLNDAPVGIRVNTLRVSREEVREELLRRGIHTSFGNLSPSALILHDRAQLTALDAYHDGWFDIQDEGSQLVGYAAAPDPRSRVLDACAGAGGKSLHMASLMNGEGSVLAADTEFHRLKEIMPRARRAGLQNIITVPTRDLAARAARSHFDTVLVDAPCSSIGTARRMPSPKWRLAERSIDKLARKQFDILSANAEFVRPGGTLVYSTCSLLPQENEEVAERFLESRSDFRPDALSSVFAKAGIDIPGLRADAFCLQITPADHGTDGFFMARFRRME